MGLSPCEDLVDFETWGSVLHKDSAMDLADLERDLVIKLVDLKRDLVIGLVTL